MMDHTFFTDLIDVTTVEGVVTLSGSVDNILAKERAARIAGKVKGVRAVVNTIEVLPPLLRSDSEIKADVEEALLLDPATESYEVKVAKGVQGVKGLENAIDVLYKLGRSDEEIRRDIEQALRWDVLVDHALIEVAVDNGRATLTGQVDSWTEYSAASENAFDGGAVVVFNQLEVR